MDILAIPLQLMGEILGNRMAGLGTQALGMWCCRTMGVVEDKKSLEKLVTAKLFNVAPLTRLLLCLQSKTVGAGRRLPIHQ